MSPRMALLTGGHCSAHPEDAVQQVCSRCGGLACSRCAAQTGLCARCARDGIAPASVRAERARTLSVIGVLSTAVGLLAVLQIVPRAAAGLWPLGFFSGIAGLVLSLMEFSAIGRGESPASGRRLAVVARAVSLVHAGLIALFFVGIFLIGVIQGFSRR